MPKTLDYFVGKTVIITGAASGIGRATALIFAREQANVVCADINEIASGAALTAPTLRDLQAAIEALRKPVVAAIEGLALGGGFELALACHWRVGARNARVGLPEVKLGLIPGAGGTQRFTRLAGPEAAIEAIVSGAQIPAERAHELKLLDGVADEAVAAAIAYASQAVSEHRPLRITSELTERIRSVDSRVFAAARSRIESKARGQLAPAKIIDAVEAACTRPKEEGFRIEREGFVACRDSPQRRALTHLFFAEREARRIPGLPANLEPHRIEAARCDAQEVDLTHGGADAPPAPATALPRRARENRRSAASPCRNRGGTRPSNNGARPSHP